MTQEISIDPAQFREAVYDGLNHAVWNLLPKGSYIRYKGAKGVEVFAFRSIQLYNLSHVTHVLTVRGDHIELNEDNILVQGGRK